MTTAFREYAALQSTCFGEVPCVFEEIGQFATARVAAARVALESLRLPQWYIEASSGDSAVGVVH